MWIQLTRVNGKGSITVNGAHVVAYWQQRSHGALKLTSAINGIELLVEESATDIADLLTMAAAQTHPVRVSDLTDANCSDG